MATSVIMCVIILAASVIFILFAVTAFKRDTTMFFWAGAVVKPEEIADAKAYNKANGIMWFVYGSLYIVAAFLAFYKIWLSVVFVGVIAVLGLPVLIWIYNRIYQKYKR